MREAEPTSAAQGSWAAPVRVAYDRRAGVAAPSGREIELDFIRGIAILMVLDFHAPVHWLSYGLSRLGFRNFGWAGVDVFFVLSGFLVGGLLIKEWRLKGRIDSRRFLIRRGFKIWPQYYVFLGVMLATHHRSLHDLWGNLLNIQNYVGGIPHTWSLAVEEHAYLLLVACLAIAAKRKVRIRTLAILLGFLCGLIVIGRMLLLQHGYEVFNRTHTRLEGILYGVLLAMVFHYRPETFRRMQSWRWFWGALLAVTLAFFRFQTQAPWSVSLGWDAADLLGIVLLMLLYRPSPVKRSGLYRFVAWIGVYSYGIYLWHVSVIAPAVWMSSYMPARVSWLWLALAPMSAGILLGALCTKLIELPALGWRDRLYPRRIDSPVGEPAGREWQERMGELKTAPQGFGA